MVRTLNWFSQKLTPHIPQTVVCSALLYPLGYWHVRVKQFLCINALLLTTAILLWFENLADWLGNGKRAADTRHIKHSHFVSSWCFYILCLTSIVLYKNLVYSNVVHSFINRLCTWKWGYIKIIGDLGSLAQMYFGNFPSVFNTCTFHRMKTNMGFEMNVK